MGFEQVYDYEHGKRDWGSSGLPREGTATDEPSAGDLARRDVPTCGLDEDLGAVRERVRAAGWDTCIVVNDRNVVLGRLGRRAIRGDDDVTVEDAMREGPSTVRPSIGVQALVDRMRENDLTSYPVTTSDGRLVGLVLLEDAERRLG
ncbi:MAG TPA: CBS domain-containing protein [Gaiellaceae bacterium]